MTHFDEKTIRETAYYIWKNNGCQAGTSQRDWEEAVNLLERKDACLLYTSDAADDANGV